MRRLGVLGAVAVVVALLVAAQLILPGIAAQRLRDRLSRSGQVLEVRVHAFPAMQLLWHRADSVVIRMATYRATPSSLPGTLAQAGDVGTLRASALGLTATVDATVSAQNGTLLVTPDVPFGGLATITVFSDPRIRVTGVSATAVPGGFTVRGTAVLR